jgi:hypothetical protein
VKNLVQLTWYNTFSKIPPPASLHFVTGVRTWRVARLECILTSLSLAITSVMFVSFAGISVERWRPTWGANSLHDYPRYFVCPDLLVAVGEIYYGIRG